MSSLHVVFALYILVSLNICNVIDIRQPDVSKSEYTCNPGESCTINCLSTLSCAAKRLYCPKYYDCSLKCDPGTNGNNACFNTEIHAETSRSLSIQVSANEANAQSMKIYTPEISRDIDNIYQSSLLCGTALNACKDLKIYAFEGFNHFSIKCDGAPTQCIIDGKIQCGYDNYKYDECNEIKYDPNEMQWLCAQQPFCVNATRLPTVSPTPFPTTVPTTQPTINPTVPPTDMPSTSPTRSPTDRPTQPPSLNAKIPSKSPTTDPTESPTADPTAMPTSEPTVRPIVAVEEVALTNDSSDFKSLYVIIIGTLTFSCILFIILAICGVVYVRFHTEKVETKIIEKYSSRTNSAFSGSEPGSKLQTNMSRSSRNSNISSFNRNNSNDTSFNDSGSQDSNDTNSDDEESDDGLPQFVPNKRMHSIPSHSNVTQHGEFYQQEIEMHGIRKLHKAKQFSNFSMRGLTNDIEKDSENHNADGMNQEMTIPNTAGLDVDDLQSNGDSDSEQLYYSESPEQNEDEDKSDKKTRLPPPPPNQNDQCKTDESNHQRHPPPAGTEYIDNAQIHYLKYAQEITLHEEDEDYEDSDDSMDSHDSGDSERNLDEANDCIEIKIKSK